MFYIIHCFDKPDSALRQQYLKQHRDYLDAQPLNVFTSGPLLDDSGENMIGSLLIMECESREQINQFIKGDPFFQKGLFESINITRWHKRQ